jgi:spore coat protein JB
MASCKNCGTANCTALQRKLQAVDFAIVDTALYLDAYPNCKKALEYYQRLRHERDVLAETIHAQCGPTTAWQNESNNTWDWIEGPWPWQFEAN